MKDNNNKPKLVLWIMIIVIIIFSSSTFIYKSVIDVVKETEDTTITEFKEEQFKSIWLYVRSLQVQSEREVSRISSNVEAELTSLPKEDLNSIERDLSEDKYSELLHDILTSYTSEQALNGVKNHKNGIVVMTADGIIEDSNYRRAIADSDVEGKVSDINKFRSWKEDLDNSYNKELNKSAFDKLMNRTSGIIAFEHYNLTGNEDHIKIDKFTYQNVLEVYLKEGVEGLRNYQIFVPYYVTDMGDIFGEPDIIQGIKNDNNKIIIAQEFNLYDQIVANQTDIFDQTTISDLDTHYKETLRLLYVFGITSITGICSLIFYFCTLYNNTIKPSKTDDEDEENITEDDDVEDKNES